MKLRYICGQQRLAGWYMRSRVRGMEVYYWQVRVWESRSLISRRHFVQVRRNGTPIKSLLTARHAGSIGTVVTAADTTATHIHHLTPALRSGLKVLRE